MKFIHCADLHLDSKIESLPQEKSKIIKEETVLAFERLLRYAKDLGVQAVLVSGDMFDGVRILNKTKLRLENLFNAYYDIDIIYLSGNHDEENNINFDVKSDNLKRFSSEWTKYTYGNVDVTGIQINSSNSKFIYDTLRLDKDKINIVMLHGQIADYKSNDNAEIISLPKLKGKNIDYLALGHIHGYVKGDLDLRGEYVYSGCLNGRGFDELGEKGFSLITVSDGKLESQFIPFSNYNFYEFIYSVNDKSNFYSCCDEILVLLKEQYNSKSLIKVVLTGEHGADFLVDKETLLSKLSEYFFYVKIYDNTSLKLNLSDYENDKSFCGEFVRLVLSSDLDEELKKQIVMTGINAFKGEDIL